MTRICIWVLARTETLSRERNDGTSRRWDTLRRKRSPAPREIEFRAILVPVGTRLRSVALTHRTRLEGRSAAYFVRHIVTKQHAEKGIGKIGARHPNRRAAGEGSGIQHKRFHFSINRRVAAWFHVTPLAEVPQRS